MDSSITHIRPRFAFTVNYPVDEALERIQKVIDDHEGELIAHVLDHHILMDIPVKERHYWSAQLNFRLEADEDDENKTQVKGLIGPRPAVWTMFIFFYFSFGVAGFFVSSYGFSKWMLGEYSHWIWALPVAALIIATTYKAGKMGDCLGTVQIEQLKDFVKEALELKKRPKEALVE